ncbi:MAG: hypothetical protein HOY71_45355 [Nonomuraea sp.]|nr:hypothetical protein [Nonomuraea sp.]
MARIRRWPAYALAALFLGYAAGKAAFAAQHRLGFPGGPPVSAAETAAYFLDPAVAQWFACATGIAGAAVAVAAVTATGQRVPRPIMLLMLALMGLAITGGGAIMAVDGFVGVGIGWSWYHGLLGLALIALTAETLRSYARMSRRARP